MEGDQKQPESRQTDSLSLQCSSGAWSDSRGHFCHTSFFAAAAAPRPKTKLHVKSRPQQATKKFVAPVSSPLTGMGKGRESCSALARKLQPPLLSAQQRHLQPQQSSMRKP